MGTFEETDWDRVSAFYDGHTREECMKEFGFSKRAWRRAVGSGLVSPRSPGTRVGPDTTRHRVRELLEQRRSYGEIARELDITKSTVAFHARHTGRQADDRFGRRYDWDAVQEAHDAGLRAHECCKHFGFSNAAWCKAVEDGRVKPRSHLIPLNDLLVVGRKTNRGHLKQRLLDAGLKEDRCEECGLVEWRGRPLSMQLHHVNGDGTDNRLENIEFLCANCHSQTDTYGGRNRLRRPRPDLRLVEQEEDVDQDAA